jgi:hypothetical protein
MRKFAAIFAAAVAFNMVSAFASCDCEETQAQEVKQEATEQAPEAAE